MMDIKTFEQMTGQGKLAFAKNATAEQLDVLADAGYAFICHAGEMVSAEKEETEQIQR